MYILGVEIYLRLYDSFSLKEKRRVLRSLFDRIHHRFFVAGAEVADHESLDRATIGFAAVSSERRHAERVLQKVINQIDDRHDVEIVDINWIQN